MTRTAVIFSLLLATVFLVSCANGPCRQLRQPQLAAQADAASVAATATPQPGTSTMPAPAPTPANLKATKAGVSTGGPMGAAAGTTGGTVANVFVYKADGSLQCGERKGTSVEEMEKELRGIKIISREKKPDGMMHISVCGSPTGMINIYEIPANSLTEAESRGFKKR